MQSRRLGRSAQRPPRERCAEDWIRGRARAGSTTEPPRSGMGEHGVEDPGDGLHHRPCGAGERSWERCAVSRDYSGLSPVCDTSPVQARPEVDVSAQTDRSTMSKRSRKRRTRKNHAANHGRKPNA